MKWLPSVVLGVALLSAVQAYPPMPPSPRPLDAVQKVALAFASEVDTARRVVWHQKMAYAQRQPQHPVPQTILPPELVPFDYHPEHRDGLSYRYELRRTSERNNYEVVFQRTGVDYITMECRAGLSLLNSASNIEEGMAFLLIPSAGSDAHQLHVLPLLPKGGQAATVRFSDGESIFDVIIPPTETVLKVKSVEPADHSF